MEHRKFKNNNDVQFVLIFKFKRFTFLYALLHIFYFILYLKRRKINEIKPYIVPSIHAAILNL